MKNKIVVVEATSTAFNYLEDIRALGYEPVILEAYLPDSILKKMIEDERKVKYSHIKYPITIIKEDPDYDVTLRKVKALDPLLVIAGGEEPEKGGPALYSRHGGEGLGGLPQVPGGDGDGGCRPQARSWRGLGGRASGSRQGSAPGGL